MLANSTAANIVNASADATRISEEATYVSLTATTASMLDFSNQATATRNTADQVN